MTSGQDVFRFGLFELDVGNRELRKQGRPVKLQDQPFRILAILVQRSGALVTREELRAELWPEGTFVEFEHSLNTAIKKVRQALREEAGVADYIETVPRYGYRFTAQITRPEAPHKPADRHLRLGWRPYIFALAALLLVVVAAAFFQRQTHAREPRSLNLTRLTADEGLSFQPAISPDGTLVAFASDRANRGNLDIWTTHKSGGQLLRLTDDPADDSDPHFCPDGRIVFRSDRAGGGVYVVPALGGTSTLLARDGRNPQCSPDGKLVAYWAGPAESSDSGGVYVVPSGGGSPTHVAAELKRARTPLWSPDGTKLLIVGSSALQPLEIDWWLAPSNGGAPARLGIRKYLDHALEFSSPFLQPATWAAVTGEAIFAAKYGQTEYATPQTSLWAVSITPDSEMPLGSVRQLTSATNAHTGASVAANGVMTFADLELNPDLWVANIDHAQGRVAEELRRLTTDRFWESRPMIRHDSGPMLFRTDRGGGWDFWRMDLVTGDMKPITISREAKVWGTLSRDGRRLAYHTKKRVFVTDISTGATRMVCTECQTQVSDWTPDGTALVVNNLTTGGIDTLTVAEGKSTPLLRAAGHSLIYASISPDGHSVAFVEASGQPYAPGRIKIAPLGGMAGAPATWKTVAHAFVAPYTPQWSPDGSMLYFISNADGPACLWAVRVWDSALRVLDEVFPVKHFHQPRFSLRGSFAVAEDRVFLGIHETTGNVWLGSAR